MSIRKRNVNFSFYKTVLYRFVLLIKFVLSYCFSLALIFVFIVWVSFIHFKYFFAFIILFFLLFIVFLNSFHLKCCFHFFIVKIFFFAISLNVALKKKRFFILRALLKWWLVVRHCYQHFSQTGLFSCFFFVL